MAVHKSKEKKCKNNPSKTRQNTNKLHTNTKKKIQHKKADYLLENASSTQRICIHRIYVRF